MDLAASPSPRPSPQGRGRSDCRLFTRRARRISRHSMLSGFLSTNLNSEFRSPKPERSPNSEFRRRQRRTPFSLRPSGFGFLSGFGLRISDFRFRGSTRGLFWGILPLRQKAGVRGKDTPVSTPVQNQICASAGGRHLQQFAFWRYVWLVSSPSFTRYRRNPPRPRSCSSVSAITSRNRNLPPRPGA